MNLLKKSSKKVAIISAILAIIFIIGFFSGGIILRHIMSARNAENEDPAKLEISIEAVIIDVQVKLLNGRTSYIIYASNEDAENRGIVYAIYPEDDTIIVDAQGNQFDCSCLVAGQSIRVRVLNVISYTGWLNQATGESIPAHGMHFCSEITIMD